MNTTDIDPLTLAIAPPPNETAQERAEREYAEAEALRIRYVLSALFCAQLKGCFSNEIDEQLRREKEGEKKKKRPVKLLLLGG